MSIKVMKFSAVWCAPCRQMQPEWDQLVDENPGVEFVSVDIDGEPVLAAQYNIMSVPTVLFVKDGVVEQTLIGLRKKADLKAVIDSLVKTG